MADAAKQASGLHVHAAPFVPVTSSCADPKPGSTSAPKAAASNGASKGAGSAAVQPTPEKAGERPASNPGSNSKGGSGGGSKGGKGGGKHCSSNGPGSGSKLSAAASATPFVPNTGSSGAAGASSSTAAGQQQQPAAEKGGKQHQGKGKGKQQQHQQQQKDQKAKDGGSNNNNSSSGGGSSKDAKLLAAAKMSPTAAAFVPKVGAHAGSSGGGTTAAAAAAAAAVAAAEALKPGHGGAQAQQQHKGGSNAAGSAATAAGRALRSPSKPGTAAGGLQGAAASGSSGGSSAATSGAAAAAASSGGASSRLGNTTRGGRGGRGSTDAGGQGGARGPNSMAGVGGAGGAAGGPYSSGGTGNGGPGAGASAGSSVWGMHGGGSNASMAAAGGGGGSQGAPGKWGLLAQHQGSYGPMYSVGGYAGGYGHGGGGYGSHHHQHQHAPLGTPAKQLLSGQFMPDGLRQQLQQSNYLIQLQYTPSVGEPPLPDKIGHYHTLYPLEDLAAAESAAGGVSAAWGVRTTCLKGISSRDGHAYCLRVVCGKQVIPSLEMLGVVRGAVDAWGSLVSHPGLLVPLEGFVATELDGSPSLVVTTAYVPGAVTLAQAHLQPTQTASGQLVRNTPSEEVLWGYATQLAAVLRAAHSVGLALRPATLSASKVLVTPVGRLKVCGLGVSEALAGEVVPSGAEELLQLQRDDVMAMGQLLLQLACAVGGLPSPSLDFAHAHYSPEFVRLLVLLLGVAEGGAFSWRSVSTLLGERLLLDMDSLAIFNEQLLDALTREMENGRLFRLVSKLAFVTDRQTSDGGPGGGGLGGGGLGGDTGNAYLLSLFRDFVFHQGEREGGRVIDWGHILENLNKLDAGVSEQVLLQSRDERSLLVVSYADIKRSVEAAVSEIRTRGAGGSSGHPGGVGAGGMGLMRPPAGGGGAHMYGHRGGLHHMGHR